MSSRVDQVGLQLEEAVASSQFEGLVTTLGGYVIIAAFLVLLYYVFSALRLHRIKRVFGFCYVVVKVWRMGKGETSAGRRGYDGGSRRDDEGRRRRSGEEEGVKGRE